MSRFNFLMVEGSRQMWQSLDLLTRTNQILIDIFKTKSAWILAVKLLPTPREVHFNAENQEFWEDT